MCPSMVGTNSERGRGWNSAVSAKGHQGRRPTGASMTTPSDLPTVSEASQFQPPTTLTFLGPAPLFRGEEVSGYDTLVARVSGAVKPADFVEEIFVRDVVDLL